MNSYSMERNICSHPFQPCLTRVNIKGIDKFHANNFGFGLNKLNGVSIGGSPVSWRVLCLPSRSLEEEFSAMQAKNFPHHEEALAQPLSSEEMKALQADSERSKLIKKLSEANQQNRFLKRQLQVKEDALANVKSELAVVELIIQSLVSLAKEIANSSIPKGSRKIKGKYIQSHLLSQLQAVQDKLEEQIKNLGAAKSQEVPVFWCGVAESVQVMGSFDGWSYGEHLSPEYTGSHTMFSTTLMLRPGRYEIKFLVDGEWRLSPEYPIVGEGEMQNNLLLVE